MIPLIFDNPLPWLIGWMPDQFTELGQAGVVVKRVTPKDRPRKFVLLLADGGPRLQEVHRLFRIRVQVWATFPNGETDWDTLTTLAAQTQYLLEKAAKTSPLIAKVTDSTGPDDVTDPNGAEYRYLTVELQLRGIPA